MHSNEKTKAQSFAVTSIQENYPATFHNEVNKNRLIPLQIKKKYISIILQKFYTE